MQIKGHNIVFLFAFFLECDTINSWCNNKEKENKGTLG